MMRSTPTPTYRQTTALWTNTSAGLRSHRQVVMIYNLYRFCIAGLFLLLFHLSPTQTALGQLDSELFLATAAGYLGFSVLALITMDYQPERFRQRIFVQVLIDIILLAILMHSSTMRNGFGILMSAAIASGSLLIGGRTAYTLAAVASLIVCVEQLMNQFVGVNNASLLSESGLLTATFFATALVSYELSERVKVSMSLADQRQDAIAQLAELNSQIISRLHAGAMVVSPQGQILLVNDYAKTIFLLQNNEAHHHLATLSQPLMDWLEKSEMTLSHQQATMKLNVAGRDYQCQLFSLSSGQDGAHRNKLIIFEDHTRTAHLAQQLKLASLGQFTASIAHEIRNPVGAISHAAQLLSESTDLSQEDKNLVEIIHKQTQRVNAVIKNILQISRRHEYAARWIDCSDWTKQFSESAHFEEIPNAKLVYEINSAQVNTLQILFDPTQLTQVLMNLCHNGLRYSLKAGKAPTVLLKWQWDVQDKTLHLDVIDFGDGVAESNRPRLFEPFYTTERQGTGLGLYLVKELCELNNVQIHYRHQDVQDDQGNHYHSCFRLSFFNVKHHQEVKEVRT